MPAIRTTFCQEPICSLLRTLAAANSCLAESLVSRELLARNNQDATSKEMCSFGKLLQSCRNATLKPELESAELQNTRPTKYLECSQSPIYS